ncbi:hypothetical protein [Streptomyces sp. NPDC013457]|uniref:hypothetical protein n=1 Tax=Streptomyces sp. NPDC013457 TaxID=3364866 RepID=UPI0036F7B689
MLAPYTATSWWTAVVAAAELLEGWGRIDEAIAMTWTRMEAEHPMALETYTRLIARHGRADEAFDLLMPHVDDWVLITALVDVASVAGRDEEAAALSPAGFGQTTAATARGAATTVLIPTRRQACSRRSASARAGLMRPSPC